MGNFRNEIMQNYMKRICLSFAKLKQDEAKQFLFRLVLLCSKTLKKQNLNTKLLVVEGWEGVGWCEGQEVKIVRHRSVGSQTLLNIIQDCHRHRSALLRIFTDTTEYYSGLSQTLLSITWRGL